MRTISFLTFLILFLSACESLKEDHWEIHSPDHGLVFLLSLKKSDSIPELSYQITAQTPSEEYYNLVKPSALGLEVSGYSLNAGLTYLKKSPVYQGTEYFTSLTGKQSVTSMNYNEQAVVFENSSGQQLTIRIRVFASGVAFRYELKNDAENTITITEEITSFGIYQGKAWMQPYDKVTKWTPGYEQPYANNIHAGATSPNEEGWCFPLLFETQNHWILITESNLDGKYPASHIRADAPEGQYQIQFPIAEEAMETGNATASFQGDWQSPWRVVIISEALSGILQSNLIDVLADSSKVEPTDWIKPGRSSWSWWSDHDSPKNPKSLKEYIDLASDMSWEYSLIDANWNEIPENDFYGLIEYAKSKNVGLWVWYNSGGPHNTVEEAPRDIMHKRETRRAEFAKLKLLGIVGVKIDFFQSDKQHIIQQYIEILEDAADYTIMVNFHGCTLPRGWSRTYPHLLTMEAVRGAETYSFNEHWPKQAPVQNTIYPFTRNVVGPVDYTPVTFSHHAFPRLTTPAHELALSVIFESGIQHFADSKLFYEKLHPQAKHVLKVVPTAWDESQLLEGYPGSYVVIARRKGNTWFIAGINGEDQLKKVELDLKFSKFNQSELSVIVDSDNNELLSETYKLVSRKINVAMKPYGGFLFMLSGSE